jgi:hypothetical protein
MTSGEESDADGYHINVDGWGLVPIGANDSVVISNLTPRDWKIELTGVPENCWVNEGKRRTVHITAARLTRATFAAARPGQNA